MSIFRIFFIYHLVDDDAMLEVYYFLSVILYFIKSNRTFYRNSVIVFAL